MSEWLYVASAEVLARGQAANGDLNELLHPETGFAPSLGRLCRRKLEEALDSDSQYIFSQEEIDAYRLETNTWELLQALLPLRKIEPNPPPKPRALLSKNPYTPTSALAQSIMLNSTTLNELVVVREWLHETAPRPRPPEAATGYWKFTKLRLAQGVRTAGTFGSGTSNRRDTEFLVKDLDPDAPNREEGKKGLAGDDANYEKALTQALYAYVRAGRLDEALELCRRNHRSWRAASLRGAIVFQWRELAGEPPDDPSVEDYSSGWSGNKRRKLWKSACTRAALNSHLPELDRALYAALAPSAATSVVLKSVCRTWEDHLWAQISIVCESKQDAEMARIGGGFWDGHGCDGSVGDMGVVDKYSGRAKVNGARREEDEEDEREDAEWGREAISALESMATVAVEEGPRATDPFHVTQLHIILNRTDKLLNEFATGLQNGEFNPDQPNYHSLTRFFAHLCLFLQMIEIPVPPHATQLILEVYLQVLESLGHRSHIAMYVSALGDNAIERYALFLTGLDLGADLQERRTALKRAEEHGLNMIRVAQVTAEKTVEKAFENLPRVKLSPLPTVVSREAPLTDVEWLLIRSIEWTTFMRETYSEAKEQANVIFRYFLALGKLNTAKHLLLTLPVELKSVQDSTDESAEYYHFLQFFGIWDVLERVSEMQAQLGPPSSVGTGSTVATAGKGPRSTWGLNFKTLIDEARTKIIDLLTSDWLLVSEPDVPGSGSLQRRQMLTCIRRIYIPELVIRLHALLVGTSDRYEGHLKNALELVNIVADSRYQLVEDFIGDGNTGSGCGKLGDYLRAVRSALLKGVDGGGADLFRMLGS